MKKEELHKAINEIRWFHSIELPYEEGGSIITPGIVGDDHCSQEKASTRFGLPLDLTDKTVLDIGTFDGYFAFLCEKRGASVVAIDPLQGCSHFEQGTIGFELAKKAIGSEVKFFQQDLFIHSLNMGFGNPIYDIVLYFGVLYHCEDPIMELHNLYKVVGEYALIETAISPEIELHGNRLPNWLFQPGHEGDPTNYFYPNLTGLEMALKHVGFSSVELLYVMPGWERVTVKAIK